MFLFRPHRQFLAEAMEEVVELKDKEDLVRHIQEEWAWYKHGYKLTNETITVEKYGNGIDKRIGWDTYIVEVKNDEKHIVAGFTNGPV